MPRYLTSLMMCICALVFSAKAEQLSFSKKQLNEVTEFNYIWLDRNKKRLSATFTLNNSALHHSFKQFKRYEPKIALRHLEVGLKKELPQLNEKHAQIHVHTYPESIEISIEGDTEKRKSIYARALQLKREIEQAYLDEIYYEYYTDTFGYHAIKPIHTRFASESIQLVTPISKHIFNNYKHYPTREIINLVLSWVQSIPYSTLENRRESHGSGFSPPNRVIMENLGDCDSKTVLAASLLRSLFPRIRIAIILVPNHAILGMQIPYQQTDDFVEIDGHFYVLAEPTGPALLPISKISERSKKYIDSKAYNAELVPLKRN